ncbi:hypothetical protein PPACK8108_LOCUS18391 [Phakopsora pachyrhizi]|uniref:Uncharacterized protein n=1 Tax=Phakopsora pachyrhizi TaxID=170000 RepID=A0AAV0BFU8_PHAPC|nr:hypothetical protein PPACK8108_LOCUS18391 [Phakopsora pachyrhizi]
MIDIQFHEPTTLAEIQAITNKPQEWNFSLPLTHIEDARALAPIPDIGRAHLSEVLKAINGFCSKEESPRTLLKPPHEEFCIGTEFQGWDDLQICPVAAAKICFTMKGSMGFNAVRRQVTRKIGPKKVGLAGVVEELVKEGKGKGGAERGFCWTLQGFEEEGEQKLGGGAHQGQSGWSKTTGATDL